MEIHYDKLVRDNIPQIIKGVNKVPKFHIAGEEEFKFRLFEKFIEEVEEFKLTPSEEELADILEIVDGLATAFNLDFKNALIIKEHKRSERGGFDKRIVLEKVVE